MIGISDESIATAEMLIGLAEIYAWIGCAVAAVFLFWGVDRVDHEARSSYLFRLFVAPGVIGLWPLVVARWIRLEVLASRGCSHGGGPGHGGGG
jgi:hypothetical protein